MFTTENRDDFCYGGALVNFPALTVKEKNLKKEALGQIKTFNRE